MILGTIPKVRALQGGESTSRKKCTSIIFMMSFYCLKVYKGEGVSENHQIWAYVLYEWSLAEVT